MIRTSSRRDTEVMARAHAVEAVDRRRVLVPANLLLVGLLAVHTLDHALRQEATVPAAGQALGLFGLLAALGSLWLAVRAGRPAPLVTAIAGIGTAAGFVAVHLLPDWGPFSQPYETLGVDTVSWLGMLLPMLGAALVGGIGLRLARARA